MLNELAKMCEIDERELVGKTVTFPATVLYEQLRNRTVTVTEISTAPPDGPWAVVKGIYTDGMELEASVSMLNYWKYGPIICSGS